ncbi:CpsB/CapC family capsule biosynthesis tyrosine phosphatase [uncultured Azonexus sp.]|uniref:tyrosine-protein phosphatase n=1 Tax=uncultured Azonexus sp. TaxID=520307 RepID=UPI0026272A8F|nr:CpsB/CapC family capsule biosynthesis tyrosine phosphatase [uncultured Azonexus sp.]
MIDLHSHLLPGVDDGAQTLEDSLALARMAVEDGIRVSVLTPHVHPGRYGNVRSELLPRLLSFQEALAAAGIPLQLRLGGEVRLGIESLELLLEGEIPFLGEVDGYRVMLLEFPHQTIPVGSQQFIEKLGQLKVRPLLAHPERNKAIMAQPDRLVGLLEAGCWLQLTAGSIAGRFGEVSQQVAGLILKNGWAHVIATDAHNLQHRPPRLREGFLAAANIVGESAAWQMVSQRPAEILGLPCN